MPLQWQKVFVPATGGIDESVAARLKPAGSLDVRNGQWLQTGEIAKRYGYEKIDSATEGADDIEGARGLFSTGDELCILGKKRLWARNDDLSQWVDRGPVAPCTVRTSRDLRDSAGMSTGDLAVVNGMCLQIGARIYKEGGETKKDLVWTIRSTDGQTHVPKRYQSGAATASSATVPHSVAAVHVGNHLVGFYVQGNATPATLIRYIDYDTSTHTEAVGGSVITSNLWAPGVTDIRPYHVTNAGADGYVVAHIDDNTFNIVLTRFSGNHLPLATATITPTSAFTRVALANDTSTNRIIVLAVDGSDLVIMGRVRTTLASAWSPVTLQTKSASADRFDDLGVTCGTVGGVVRACASWTYCDPQSSGRIFSLRHRFIDADGTGSVPRWDAYGLAARSQPFYENGSFYVVAVTTCAEHVYAPNPDDSVFAVGAVPLQTSAFEAHVLLELFRFNNPTTTTRQPALCGAWDIGAAVQVRNETNLNNLARLGNAPNVYSHAAGRWLLSSTTMVRVLQSEPASAAIDKVELDFTRAPLAASSSGGCAAIGGAYVSWYDGSRTQELGYVCAAFHFDGSIAALSQVDLGENGELEQDTKYQWLTVRKRFDAKGNLHRSLPSAPVEVEITAPNNAVTMQFTTSHASNLVNIARDTIDVYRAGADSVYKLCSEPQRIIPNRASTSHVTASFTDNGRLEADELYTTGGAIEAVCPEGARIVASGIGRLWLGDLARAARVQYSKPIAPGTAFEDALAPEFNEGFGYLVPSGEEVTGIGELDDKMVVFSTREIYLIAGRGPADDGSQNDFSGLVQVSNDAGCIDPRSVVSAPDGVFFQSGAGLYKIGRGLEIEFVGQNVRDSMASYPVVTSAVLVQKRNQVRFTCTTTSGLDAIVLVYDYRIRQWARWNILHMVSAVPTAFVPVGACMHADVYHMVDSSGRVMRETTSSYKDETNYVRMRVETGWVQAQGPGSWQRIRRIAPFLAWKNAHALAVNAYVDYSTLGAVQTETFANTDLVAFENETVREQPLLRLNNGKVQAVKLRIEDSDDGSTTGEGYVFGGIMFELGAKNGALKLGATDKR